jgi:rhodanese-related sulfurtransferase
MYKGEVTPKEAFARLKANPGAVLIDVRTQPEWAFVGVPAVERLLRISWQDFPQMQVNRSGARSAAAAHALTQAGFTNAWNVSEGFEGDRNEAGQRATVGGWKSHGLPWVQN